MQNSISNVNIYWLKYPFYYMYMGSNALWFMTPTAWDKDKVASGVSVQIKIKSDLPIKKFKSNDMPNLIGPVFV